jgi:acyl-CoA reductase-like NAD-dependent aldehyde dehydrogenase
VHKDIYAEFLAAMVAATKKFDLGPIQNKMQYDKVQGYIQESVASSQRIILGGNHIAGKGYYVESTIIDNPPDDSKIVIEEPFGLFPLTFVSIRAC